jgi:hypothetical protein
MKKNKVIWVLLILAAAASGCGDTYPSINRDLLNTMNELTDMLGKVEDEEGAKYYTPIIFRMRGRIEEIRKREADFLKNSGMEDATKLLKDFEVALLMKIGGSEKLEINGLMDTIKGIKNEWQADEEKMKKLQAIVKWDVLVEYLDVKFDPALILEKQAATGRFLAQLKRISELAEKQGNPKFLSLLPDKVKTVLKAGQ